MRRGECVGLGLGLGLGLEDCFEVLGVGGLAFGELELGHGFKDAFASDDLEDFDLVAVNDLLGETVEEADASAPSVDLLCGEGHLSQLVPRLEYRQSIQIERLHLEDMVVRVLGMQRRDQRRTVLVVVRGLSGYRNHNPKLP